jgi:hypothetical protein
MVRYRTCTMSDSNIFLGVVEWERNATSSDTFVSLTLPYEQPSCSLSCLLFIIPFYPGLIGIRSKYKQHTLRAALFRPLLDILWLCSCVVVCEQPGKGSTKLDKDGMIT